ncbi:MAG: DNA-directed RNA polymerase subunit beta [Clostridiales bacterium]|nr:DNA-directed RNA polymerase subunit beta [Clostridiales bacterium]
MEKNRIHTQPYGNRIRMSFAREKSVLEMPNLLDVQKDSYNWFIDEGLREVFEDINPIVDFSGNLSLEFVDFNLKSTPKYSIQEAKERDATYSAPLKVKVRLTNGETGEVQEHEVFMGDFPLMTETGTFVINGAERVIVSQLVRSPGIYYARTIDKTGKNLYSSTVIPNRGAWLEYETDSNDIFYVRVDRNRKLPVTVLIRALGVGTDAEIREMFGEDPKLLATLERDTTRTVEEGLMEIYRRLRPGEPPTVESSKSLLYGMFYDSRRYNLARVGRYKFNKKLMLHNRIVGCVLMEDVVNQATGELLASAGEVLTEQLCDDIQNAGIPYVIVNREETPVKILSNLMVDIKTHLDLTDEQLKACNIGELVYFPVLEEILEADLSGDELLETLKKESYRLIPRHITFEDIMASINYNMHLDYGIGNVDDIDHLGNRRIRCVGELLQNQFRIGLARLERVVRERMTTQDLDDVTPQALINIRPVTAAVKEFFGSSQLSQFMDQNNPLAELTHKRRLSALGPGGLSRDRAGFEVRDVHHSHYGRMCPIETPEGPNIGLINSLATYARINRYGFIESPYRKIDKSGDAPVVTEDVIYITADEEEKYRVAQANEPLDEQGHFLHSRVTGRFGEDNIELEPERMDLMDVSPRQVFSVATTLIPFLENDDAHRALMGSNMQRQAVPLLVTEKPIVGTGMEYKAAMDSGSCIIAKRSGTVESVSAVKIRVRADEDGTVDVYELLKFQRQNQSTCFNQRPVVNKGQHVEAGEAIADGPSTDEGELALGKNPLIGFMTWEGYNYEDAVLLSERLVAEDIYTSVHIEEYETEARETKLGPEEITRDIPNVGEDALKDLDERGIIRIGAEVHAGDILVGKVTPKGETELTAEERLLRAIFGEKAREVRDTSLRVPHGEEGIIVEVKIFTRENGDEMNPGVNELVRVYIAHKRKISVGDKMAGRHGNKGVVSRVLPVEDMPFLPNGRPLDIVLNPLGVPSRMNLGQVLEVHLGLAAKVLGMNIATPVFDGATQDDIMECLQMADDYVNTPWEDFKKKYKKQLDPDVLEFLEDNQDHREEWAGVPISTDGKMILRDGRTGEPFDNHVTVGYMYYMKLHHLVDDKIHARSTGPYALVTQQPLGGKAQFGGQRFGEMEVWALEAYGAAYTLQEILTVKSDDIVGRVKTYEAIVKGENIPPAGVPESFKVLLKELQSLGLDMRVLTEDRREVIIAEDLDDDGEPINVNMEGLEDGVLPSGDYDNTTDDSYTVEDEEDDELDLDDDVPYTLEDAGFSISDPDSMDDSIFE